MATKTFGQVPTITKVDNKQFFLVTDSAGAVSKTPSKNVNNGADMLSGEALLPMRMCSLARTAQGENSRLPTASKNLPTYAFKVKLPNGFYETGDEIEGLGTVVSDGIAFFRKKRCKRAGKNTPMPQHERCTKYAEYGLVSNQKSSNILKFSDARIIKSKGFYLIPLFAHLESLAAKVPFCESLFVRNPGGYIEFSEHQNLGEDSAQVYYSRFIKVMICRKIEYVDKNGMNRNLYGEKFYGRLFIQQGGSSDSSGIVNNETYMNFVLK